MTNGSLKPEYRDLLRFNTNKAELPRIPWIPLYSSQYQVKHQYTRPNGVKNQLHEEYTADPGVIQVIPSVTKN